jgi:hypothetical protein
MEVSKHNIDSRTVFLQKLNKKKIIDKINNIHFNKQVATHYTKSNKTIQYI